MLHRYGMLDHFSQARTFEISLATGDQALPFTDITKFYTFNMGISMLTSKFSPSEANPNLLNHGTIWSPHRCHHAYMFMSPFAATGTLIGNKCTPFTSKTLFCSEPRFMVPVLIGWHRNVPSTNTTDLPHQSPKKHVPKNLTTWGWGGEQLMVPSNVPARGGSRPCNPYFTGFFWVPIQRQHNIGSSPVQHQLPQQGFHRRGKQLHQLHRSQHRPQDTEYSQPFNHAPGQFLESISPTVNNLIMHTNTVYWGLVCTQLRVGITCHSRALTRAEQQAQQVIQLAVTTLLSEGKYGHLKKQKPGDTIQIMFENFSSLWLFASGKTKGMKICQINKLTKDYHINVMAGCETWVDWRFTSLVSNRYNTLLAQGQLYCRICANKVNEYICQDQWGETCMPTVERLLSFVLDTGKDTSGLRRWCWILLGEGGKTTHILTSYTPFKPYNNTGKETVGN